MTHWDTIRTTYPIEIERMKEAAQKDHVGRIDPYFLPWREWFSPIEDMTWNAIRCAGIPLYPQIPVLNYFIDFGNPILRVGLEVDGANWHQDVSRDRKRDAWIAREGWHIYRCTALELAS